MITMSVSPSSLRAGDILPAAGADEAPSDGSPSFDDLLRRHVADQPHDERRGFSPGERPPVDRHTAGDRPGPSVRCADRGMADRGMAERSTGDSDVTVDHAELDDSRLDASKLTDSKLDDSTLDDEQTGAIGSPDPRGAIENPVDGSAQSAAAPSGQAPASSPEAAALPAPAGRTPVAVVPPAATGQALTAPIDALAAPGTAPVAPATDAPDAAPGVIIQTITVEHIAGTGTAAELAAKAALDALTTTVQTGQLAATEPSLQPAATAPGAAPATGVGTPADVATPAGQLAPHDAGSIATPATTTAMPGAPAQAGGAAPTALPPTALAAAAAIAATDPAMRPATQTEQITATGASVEARPDPTAAVQATKPGAVAANGTVPGGLPAEAASTLPSPLHDAVAQAQRDLQIRRAEQVTRLGIDLATEGLGAIHVEATNAGGGLQLQLGADRAATRQLLAEHAATLRDELGGGGTSVSVDIGRGDAGRSDQRADERGAHQSSTTGQHGRSAPSAQSTQSAHANPALTSARPAISGDGGVDVRL